MLKTFRFWLSILLSLLAGSVFILSSISKFPSLENFGWTIVETLPVNWMVAEWLARILTGMELILGICFLAQFQIKKWIIPISAFLLIVFTLYLLLAGFRLGIHENCGCFGEWIPMTPLQSILKNGALLILLFLLHRFYSLTPYTIPRWITTTVALLVLSVPFFYWPPESMYIREHEKALHRKVPLSTLYHSSGNRPPAVELRRGKHIIAYLSLSCRFCRKAARRLSIMYEKHPEIPFYFILNGNPDMLDSFLKETHSASVPHSLFNGAHQFMTLNNGYSLPTIQWMEDSIQVRQSNYITLSEGEIMEWLKH